MDLSMKRKPANKASSASLAPLSVVMELGPSAWGHSVSFIYTPIEGVSQLYKKSEPTQSEGGREPELGEFVEIVLAITLQVRTPASKSGITVLSAKGRSKSFRQ